MSDEKNIEQEQQVVSEIEDGSGEVIVAGSGDWIASMTPKAFAEFTKHCQAKAEAEANDEAAE